jgi:hypothetical protein
VIKIMGTVWRLSDRDNGDSLDTRQGIMKLHTTSSFSAKTQTQTFVVSLQGEGAGT